MERHNGIEFDPEGAFVYYDDAQRALDAEREKVKRLSTCGTDHSTPWWQVKCEDLEAQLATLKARCAHLDVLLRDEYLPKLDVVAVQRSIVDRDSRIDALEREVEKLDDDKETLQAQLAEIEQILCIESGKTTVDKVRDLHQSFKQVWNSYQSAVNELFDTQAQIRQVREDSKRVECTNEAEMPSEIWTDINGYAARTRFKGGVRYIRATLAAQDAHHHTEERHEQR